MSVLCSYEAATILSHLREDGWSVAVHNDYHLGPQRLQMTFWLLTRPADGVGVLGIQGEGLTDQEALTKCAQQARDLFKPSP